MPTPVRFCVPVLIGALLLVCGGRPARPPAKTPAADLAALRQQAAAAYAAHDVRAFLRHAQEALAQVPGHPRWLYNLACGHALAGEPAAALAALAQLADKRLYFDLAADPDLETLRREPGYEELVHRFGTLLEPRVRSEEAFRAGPPDFIPEGIAYDTASGAFFLGSVRRGSILRVSPVAGGEASVETFLAAGTGLGSVLGMAVDSKRRILWAVTAALPQYDPALPPPRHPNALVHIDLDRIDVHRGDRGRSGMESRGPRVFYPVLEETDGSFNDLAIAPNGTVVVSDAAGGALFRRSPGAESLEVLLPPGTFQSPQGLAFSADGSRLWLADYSRGLFVVDPETRAVRPVDEPTDATLLGIDGLSRAGKDLIAIQNGVRPHRVLRLVVDEDRPAVLSVEILEMAHPAYQEPTLGVVVGEDLFYAANSQWNRFDAEGNLPPSGDLEPPRVLRLPLRQRELQPSEP